MCTHQIGHLWALCGCENYSTKYPNSSKKLHQNQQIKTKENFAKFKWLVLNTLKKFVPQVGLGVGGKGIAN